MNFHYKIAKHQRNKFTFLHFLSLKRDHASSRYVKIIHKRADPLLKSWKVAINIPILSLWYFDFFFVELQPTRDRLNFQSRTFVSSQRIYPYSAGSWLKAGNRPLPAIHPWKLLKLWRLLKPVETKECPPFYFNIKGTRPVENCLCFIHIKTALSHQS